MPPRAASAAQPSTTTTDEQPPSRNTAIERTSHDVPSGSVRNAFGPPARRPAPAASSTPQTPEPSPPPPCRGCGITANTYQTRRTGCAGSMPELVGRGFSPDAEVLRADQGKLLG